MNPHIVFKINKSLDKKVVFEFLHIQAGGINFFGNIIKVHPKLISIKKLSLDKQQLYLDKYVDAFYQREKNALKDSTNLFQRNWNRVEEEYLQEVMNIFHGYHFPKGKYFGYISIFPCNPRFLHNKTFQIFYKNTNTFLEVISHELLHIIFYDYCIKEHPTVFKNLDTNTGIFWDLSEIFNSIILSLPEFVHLHGQKDIKPYPEHKKYIVALQKLWIKYEDIDKWFIASLKYIQSEKINDKHLHN